MGISLVCHLGFGHRFCFCCFQLHHEIFWDDKIDKLWSPQDLAFHCLPLALVDAGFAKDWFFSRKHIQHPVQNCHTHKTPWSYLKLWPGWLQSLACVVHHLSIYFPPIRPYSGYWQATGMDHSTRFSGTAASTDFREAMAKPDVTSFNQIRSVCSGTQISHILCHQSTHCSPSFHMICFLSFVSLIRSASSFSFDRFMHPNGQLPAYEWNFNDVNPPVHAGLPRHGKYLHQFHP